MAILAHDSLHDEELDPFADVPTDWIDRAPQAGGEAPAPAARQQCQDFLHLLWGAEKLPGYGLIWAFPSKISKWHESIGTMATDAISGADSADVYFGCGLAGSETGPHKRCEAKDIIAIPGVWMDIDIKHEAHKNTNLPTSVDAVFALMGDVPIPPTVIVHSGHGVHAWWLLLLPWMFKGSDNEKAAALVKAWQDEIIKLGKAHGWKFDNTADLARVLRPPGTVNHKGKPAPVKVTKTSAMRYTIEDIEAALITMQQKAPAQETPTPSPIRPTMSVDLDDDALLKKAMAAKHGDKLSALWAGQLNGHKSQSEADADLCCRLAWWTGRDAARVDRLFRLSGLMRPKWDERHAGDGRAYGQMTIDHTITIVQGGYDPSNYSHSAPQPAPPPEPNR